MLQVQSEEQVLILILLEMRLLLNAIDCESYGVTVLILILLEMRLLPGFMEEVAGDTQGS